MFNMIFVSCEKVKVVEANICPLKNEVRFINAKQGFNHFFRKDEKACRAVKCYNGTFISLKKSFSKFQSFEIPELTRQSAFCIIFLSIMYPPSLFLPRRTNEPLDVGFKNLGSFACMMGPLTYKISAV